MAIKPELSKQQLICQTVQTYADIRTACLGPDSRHWYKNQLLSTSLLKLDKLGVILRERGMTLADIRQQIGQVPKDVVPEGYVHPHLTRPAPIAEVITLVIDNSPESDGPVVAAA